MAMKVGSQTFTFPLRFSPAGLLCRDPRRDKVRRSVF